MTKIMKTRKELAAMIVERVNRETPEKIEGVDIVPVHNPVVNWTIGLIWPPVARNGVTEAIVVHVVAELCRDFDIVE
ncbi:hypothetical protein ACTGJ9_037005 [Bradyrhizobium sp. RDM12]